MKTDMSVPTAYVFWQGPSAVDNTSAPKYGHYENNTTEDSEHYYGCGETRRSDRLAQSVHMKDKAIAPAMMRRA